MRTVERTARADEDLLRIWIEVAQHDPAAADRLLDRIEKRLGQLSCHPYTGVAREDIGPGVRHLVTLRYLILHEVTGERVLILRVLDGRRRITEEPLA